jgi:hypothetical protein
MSECCVMYSIRHVNTGPHVGLHVCRTCAQDCSRHWHVLGEWVVILSCSRPGSHSWNCNALQCIDGVCGAVWAIRRFVVVRRG